MSRKRAVVICPGRGTYNKSELGYFHRHHADRADLLAGFDAKRKSRGQELLADLDQAAAFSVSRHTRGDNASALIHACAYADFLSIDREAFEIVAVTGNSMGWYIALACAGALSVEGGFDVVNTMGTLMQEALIGGQLLYPYVDANWPEVPGRKGELLDLIDATDGLYLSIDLGGMLVFAGTDEALKVAETKLPPLDGRYPMRLQNHAGFHSPLQQPISGKGFAALNEDLFSTSKFLWSMGGARSGIPVFMTVPDCVIIHWETR